MVGYSGTPLPKKLGIKEGHRVAVLNAPPDFDLTGGLLKDLPFDVELHKRLIGRQPFDVILFFPKDRRELEKRFAAIVNRLDPAGGFWVAWPKRASGVTTDLTEDVVRAIALDAGLVDNKVCAIDETWSGLRVVIRLRDRRQ